jgi:sigma-B regulation protein RsbU (phosphoserine phosphatase)
MFEQAEYGTSRCALSVQDMVLLFTDGLFEVEGAGGVLYDQGSLLRAVNRRAYLKARELCSEVLAEVRQFSANRQFNDDVCLVAFEVERVGV